MKIALISDSETGVNIFQKIRAAVEEEAADIKMEEAFVPTKLDIPHKALELSGNSDLLFVFSLYSEKDFVIEILLEKLVDVELQTGKKIIKAVEQSELDEIIDATEKNTAIDELAEKWASFIIAFLYHPEKFVPQKEEEESEEEFESFSGV